MRMCLISVAFRKQRILPSAEPEPMQSVAFKEVVGDVLPAIVDALRDPPEAEVGDTVRTTCAGAGSLRRRESDHSRRQTGHPCGQRRC